MKQYRTVLQIVKFLKQSYMYCVNIYNMKPYITILQTAKCLKGSHVKEYDGHYEKYATLLYIQLFSNILFIFLSPYIDYC